MKNGQRKSKSPPSQKSELNPRIEIWITYIFVIISVQRKSIKNVSTFLSSLLELIVAAHIKWGRG
jgi:hypothetical protein